MSPADGRGGSGGRPDRKLVLTVIDGLKPAMLERAVETGRAPMLGLLMERGVYVADCVAAFPSVTPTCAATIATGVGPDRHLIPSMNWYSRLEGRYVEYGSSLSASRQFGIFRSLTDTVYNMNALHLSQDVRTVFEELDDAGVRTAGTTYLMYRGRHRHEVARESALARLATATFARRSVMGPRELFYADIFASRPTGCRGQLGMPGARDRHSGCVGAYLVRHDLYDFLLYSLPDNDTWSHRNGPHAQVRSIAVADRQIERLMRAAGGPDAFLERNAMVVLGDHSHSPVERSIRLLDAFADRAVARPTPGSEPVAPELAICPAQRSAMIYVLADLRRDRLLAEAADIAAALEGVDLVITLQDGRGVVRRGDSALRFWPGGEVGDRGGRSWTVEGDVSVLGKVSAGTFSTPDYPDALARVWSALTCPAAGDVLLSAAPGYEFVDWGGADHVGGGSHGSLHRVDSLGALLWCGTGPPYVGARPQWTLSDVLPMVREHFGLAA